jgi:hypothetical protein
LEDNLRNQKEYRLHSTGMCPGSRMKSNLGQRRILPVTG